MDDGGGGGRPADRAARGAGPEGRARRLGGAARPRGARRRRDLGHDRQRAGDQPAGCVGAAATAHRRGDRRRPCPHPHQAGTGTSEEEQPVNDEYRDDPNRPDPNRMEELAARARELAARAEEMSRQAATAAESEGELAALERELSDLDAEERKLDAEFTALLDDGAAQPAGGRERDTNRADD